MFTRINGRTPRSGRRPPLFPGKRFETGCASFPAHTATVDPVTVTGGNMQLHFSSCETAPPDSFFFN